MNLMVTPTAPGRSRVTFRLLTNIDSKFIRCAFQYPPTADRLKYACGAAWLRMLCIMAQDGKADAEMAGPCENEEFRFRWRQRELSGPAARRLHVCSMLHASIGACAHEMTSAVCCSIYCTSKSESWQRRLQRAAPGRRATSCRQWLTGVLHVRSFTLQKQIT